MMQNYVFVVFLQSALTIKRKTIGIISTIKLFQCNANYKYRPIATILINGVLLLKCLIFHNYK